MFQKLKKKVKNYFFSGLLLLIPLIITILVIRALFIFLDNLLLPYLKPYLGDWVPIPGIGILLILLIIFITGIFVTNYIGGHLVNLGEKILFKIPIAKSVYASVKQIIETLSFNDKQSYRKVVLVEYPKKDIWSVGVVNGESINPENKEKMYNILIIASINPTSGYFILVPKSNVIHVDISIEEAMKWIVSGGIITPKILKS